MLLKHYKRLERFITNAKVLIHADVTLNQIVMLSEVANNEGNIRMADVIEKYDWSRTTGSRAYRKLSAMETPTKEGFNLIKTVDTAYNTREKYLELTEKGREVVKELDKSLA